MHVTRTGWVLSWGEAVVPQDGRVPQLNSNQPKTNAHRPNQPFGQRGRDGSGDHRGSTHPKTVDRDGINLSQVMRMTGTRR
jgi:hypothetical protein